MMIFTRLDTWLGKALFHPPIISLCHATRQTQYAIHRALWFFAALHATYYDSHGGWGWTTFLWMWVIFNFLGAVLVPDMEAKSYGPFRAVFWLLFLINVSGIVVLGEVSNSVFRELMILFAEYAATIKTIPPRRKRERRTSAKEARI